jgi:hypothetical protein
MWGSRFSQLWIASVFFYQTHDAVPFSGCITISHTRVQSDQFNGLA